MLDNNINNIFSYDCHISTTLTPKESFSESENDYYNLNSNYNKNFPFSGIIKKESLDEENMEIEINNYLVKDNNRENKEIAHKFKIINIKRGRKKVKNNKRIHNSYSVDNLFIKIRVHYFSFIISYINNILKELNYNLKFYNLNYKFKKLSKKEEIKSLEDKTIGQIICNDISSKYKSLKLNYNQLIYKKIANNEVLNNILSENYLQLFQKIYFRNKRKINLTEYGLDKTINLSNEVKMYNDLLLKVEGKSKGIKRYMNICIKKKFIPNLIFIVN